MTAVAVYSYTHSVTYVTDNILKSLKDIIRLSGLNPEHLTNDWATYAEGIRNWIESGHLSRVTLEVYDPKSNALITRWDIEIVYEWTSGDGSFWTDTDLLKYHIKKAGVVPSEASYTISVHTKPNAPEVSGWRSYQLRSTTGLVRQSMGSTIEHNGLGASTSYYRRA